MNVYLKIAIFAMIGFTLGVISFISFKAITGNYFATNIFVGIFYGFIILLVIIGLIKLAQKVWTLVLIGISFTLLSCNYAKSNQQVVVSDDCGMTWNKINAGDAVPKGTINACYMKVVIPNYPMQGDAIFVTNLKEKVRATTHIDYDYSIVNALSFIKQAKFLGKANKEADDTEALDEKRFEMAENMIIDKRIKDVAKRVFLSQDIVELDQSEVENLLLVECNKILEPLGISLNFITLTFDLDEQTRQAIDVSTAMKIYQSKGLEELGKQVMIERAGATKITVENKTTEQPKVE